MYYVNAHGAVSTVADQDIRPNGLMLSANGKTLYVTNVTSVLAFDVSPDGSTRNRHEFGAIAGDTGADGMAIDAAGRLYVTASTGVHVLGPDGAHLGLIPTPPGADFRRVLRSGQEDLVRGADGGGRSGRKAVVDTQGRAQHRDDDLPDPDAGDGLQGPAEVTAGGIFDATEMVDRRGGGNDRRNGRR